MAVTHLQNAGDRIGAKGSEISAIEDTDLRRDGRGSAAGSLDAPRRIDLQTPDGIVGEPIAFPKMKPGEFRLSGYFLSRGKSEGRPEGAKRPTAGDEPREFTSRGKGGRVPPFFEKLPFWGMHLPMTARQVGLAQILRLR